MFDRTQKIEFIVQFSESLSVFEFVNHLTENFGKNAYKDAFETSVYNSPENDSLLRTFERINLFYWYEYSQYPYGNKVGGCTYFLLCKNLIESKTLEEFESRSYGIIPNSDLAELSRILIAFLPVYREIILKPNKPFMDRQIEQINRKINKTDISGIVFRVRNFHNSSWDVSRPFVLNICPTGPSKSIHATAFFNYAFTNLPIDQEDMNLLLSIIFHECFHIIYDEQSLDFKLEFAKWFRENPSMYSKYAELLFNEAITTALGGGYLWNHISETPLPSEKWYNNKYIASMAFEMYPMTLKYLKEDKQIDKSYVDDYISLYENKFPGWIQDVDNVLSDRFVICESGSIYKAISKRFRYRNIDEFAEVLNLVNLQKLKSAPITKLVLLSESPQEKIGQIKQVFPELKDWDPDVNRDFSHSVFLQDKTYLIIVNVISKTAEDLISSTKF